MTGENGGNDLPLDRGRFDVASLDDIFAKIGTKLEMRRDFHSEAGYDLRTREIFPIGNRRRSIPINLVHHSRGENQQRNLNFLRFERNCGRRVGDNQFGLLRLAW